MSFNISLTVAGSVLKIGCLKKICSQNPKRSFYVQADAKKKSGIAKAGMQ